MTGSTAIQTVSLSFFRFHAIGDRLAAFTAMALARPALARTTGTGFWKLCGAGAGEGFTPTANSTAYAILATWPDMASARLRVEDGDGFNRFRRRACEEWTVFLKPISARGAWAGVKPFTPQPDDAASGPIAALTRASLRPAAAIRFWRRVPEISRAIGCDQTVIFKIGIGEIPLLHQVTFSIWPDIHAMSDFARAGGPHARAVRAVREQGWFREELYARFRVLADIGTWHGSRPLAEREKAA